MLPGAWGRADTLCPSPYHRVTRPTSHQEARPGYLFKRGRYGGQPTRDANHLYEVERRVFHAECPSFRILELQLSPT